MEKMITVHGVNNYIRVCCDNVIIFFAKKD